MDPTTSTLQLAHAYLDALERRDWPAVGALLDPDVVYDMPQSSERIHGRERYLQFNREYPGDWHLVPRRVLADGALAALWVDARVGDERLTACIWLETSDGRSISRVTDFWPEPYEPPAGREHLVDRY